MMNDFKSAPYLYLGFCTEDGERVAPIIRVLGKEGVSLWYDRPEDENCMVAEGIKNAAAALFFLSEQAVKSEQIFDKLAFATKQRTQIIPVFLEDMQLTAGLRMMLHHISSVLGYRYSAEQLAELLISIPLVKECIKK